MQDVVTRVPRLAFLNMADVLVFARSGRSNAEGAFATCHSLTLPPSEPGYYFWRDRTVGRNHPALGVVRRPNRRRVTVGRRPIRHDFAFGAALSAINARADAERAVPSRRRHTAAVAGETRHRGPRSCHHIDPQLGASAGSRAKTARYSASCHGPDFFQQVADGPDVSRQPPDPEALRFSAATIFARSRNGLAAWFRPAFRNVSLVSPALHRAARGTDAVRGRSSGRRIEESPRRQRQPIQLHRRTICTSGSSPSDRRRGA